MERTLAYDVKFNVLTHRGSCKSILICHSREGGNPEVPIFEEYWIPDKNLGNDKLRLLHESRIGNRLVEALT
jgi:hypothetical protein